ncbi:LLM class flavin-dependent oxidoreductase [Actinomadura madurae]|uniref:LLM class flavin-dependent oxidoreductase n=1 Tax=Actinomadura madurae TaxID=1993 RepID=UPI0020D21B4F|nr:LLM class flavin-dependent oxidoreductase [Actinomadura madurae]MCQ0016352.1 LLM class flavin-dependent oxidoreductase [Actinomadura madurae]
MSPGRSRPPASPASGRRRTTSPPEGSPGAATVLAATRRVTVGTGLLSVFARHPALTAMEAGTLASAYPGRFRLGVGSGGLGWLDQQGIAHARPLSAVRGSVAAVRALLHGEKVTGEHGGFTFDGVALEYPPERPPPIWIGATGPKMTALTGEIADGLLLSVFSSPEFVRVEREIMAASSGAGKPISTLAFFVLDDDTATARAKIRPILASYLARRRKLGHDRRPRHHRGTARTRRRGRRGTARGGHAGRLDRPARRLR